MSIALALPVGSVVSMLALAGLGVLALVAAVLSVFYFLRARVYERIEGTLPAATGEATEMRALGERIEAIVGQQQLQGETQRQMLAQKIDAVGQRFDEQRATVDGLRNEVRHEARRRDAEMDEIRHQIAAIQSAPAALPAPSEPARSLGDGTAPDAVPVERVSTDAWDVAASPTATPLASPPAYAFEVAESDAASFTTDEPAPTFAPETFEPVTFTPEPSTAEAVEFAFEMIEPEAPAPFTPEPAATEFVEPATFTPEPFTFETVRVEPEPAAAFTVADEPAMAFHVDDTAELVPPAMAFEPAAMTFESMSFETIPPAPAEAPPTFETVSDPFAWVSVEPAPSAPASSADESVDGPANAFPFSAAAPDEAPALASPPPPGFESVSFEAISLASPSPAGFEAAPPAPFDAWSLLPAETPTPPAPPADAAWVARSDRTDAPTALPPSAATVRDPFAQPLPEAAPTFTPAAFQPVAPEPAPEPEPFAVPEGADDLTVISTIDGPVQHALYLAGVTKLDEIARWGRGDARRISASVGVSEDTIMGQWIFEAQSALFDQYARQAG